MAKKVPATMKAELTKNSEKGGAWLASYVIIEGDSAPIMRVSAWSNPSAAKRWVKEAVLQNTPRKSIKWELAKKSLEDKPLAFNGLLEYKVDA